MVTAIKNILCQIGLSRSFVIFDIRALWRSVWSGFDEGHMRVLSRCAMPQKILSILSNRSNRDNYKFRRKNHKCRRHVTKLPSGATASQYSQFRTTRCVQSVAQACMSLHEAHSMASLVLCRHSCPLNRPNPVRYRLHSMGNRARFCGWWVIYGCCYWFTWYFSTEPFVYLYDHSALQTINLSTMEVVLTSCL